MIASRSAWAVPACLLLAACGVDGRDASGHAVRLTVDGGQFTEPVAEGG